MSAGRWVSVSNWNSIAIKRSTFGLETMTSCINSHIRPNQTVIADVYFCNVEHRTIIISMEIVADMDILAKVRLLNRLISSDVFANCNSTSSLISVRLNVIFSINSDLSIN